MKNLLLIGLITFCVSSAAQAYQYTLKGNGPLADAITNQDIDQLTHLLGPGESKEELFIDEYKGTPLMWAVALGKPLSAETILTLGADPNEKLPNLTTALHLAVAFERTECVRILAKFGADLNAEDARGATPFFMAVRGYDFFDKNSFQSAMLVNPAKELVTLGADPNRVDSNGFTPLMIAAGNREYAKMTDMVHAGADVNFNKGTLQGQTALTAALMNDDPIGIKLLCKWDADPNLGGTLFFAIRSGRQNEARALLECGADANRIWNGLSPLEIAIVSKSNEGVALLLDFGADTYGRSSTTGIDALKLAYRTGHWGGVLKILIHRYGADGALGAGIGLALYTIKEAVSTWRHKKPLTQAPKNNAPKKPTTATGRLFSGAKKALQNPKSGASAVFSDEQLAQIDSNAALIEEEYETPFINEKDVVTVERKQRSEKDYVIKKKKPKKKSQVGQLPKVPSESDIKQTKQFKTYVNKLEKQIDEQLAKRIQKITGEEHDYGDFKLLERTHYLHTLADGRQIKLPLYELRFHNNGGMRVYIASPDGKTLLFLRIGNKQTQDRDIEYLTSKQHG